ncbi:MAG: serpin family protein [Candidatus Binataceae bacterium]
MMKQRAVTLTCLLASIGLVALAITAPVARAADVSSTDASGLAKSDNGFGFRLLGALLGDQTTGNVIISPFSVAQALTMTYNGARGTTETAMARTLGLESQRHGRSAGAQGTGHRESLSVANRQLLDELKRADPKVQLAIANALWIKKTFAIRPAFVRENQEFYDATVQKLDFASDPGPAAEIINTWVNRNTHGKIPTIVEGLHRDTTLVLTDAVYFKGRWSDQFNPRVTAPRPFHLAGGKTESIPMMARTSSYLYLENQELQAIRLPYGNGRLAMYVLLPRKADGVAELAQSLDENKWDRLINSLDEDEGTIILPKFELKYGELLNGALKAIGMGVAFEPGKADFSGISADRRVYISDVQHKTYVKVDEEGTEAAAATSVTARATAMVRPAKPPFKMIVDHPFCFVIAERDTGAILFVGVVHNPAGR